MAYPNQRGNFKSRGAECWQHCEKGHIQRDCKLKKDGEGKSKEKDSAYVMGSDRSDALILSLAGSSESWVIYLGALFTSLSHMTSFKTM